MTLTHLSHFGLTIISTTTDSVVFEGSLSSCRRMAFAHGMEVSQYVGKTIGIEGGRAINTPADSESFSICYFVGGGLIAKTRDGYCLVMPKAIWSKSL